MSPFAVHKVITVLGQLIVYDVLSGKLGFDNETSTHTNRNTNTYIYMHTYRDKYYQAHTR